MNRLWPTALALVAAVIVQVSIAPYLAVFKIVPNVMFLVVVTLALVEGPVAGCVTGFAAGLLFDLLGTQPVGPWALVLCVVGYIAGLLHATMFAESWRQPVTVVAIASLTGEIAYGIILTILDPGMPFFSTLATIMLPTALYTTVLAVLVYPWLARLLRRDQSIRSFRRVA